MEETNEKQEKKNEVANTKIATIIVSLDIAQLIQVVVFFHFFFSAVCSVRIQLVFQLGRMIEDRRCAHTSCKLIAFLLVFLEIQINFNRHDRTRVYWIFERVLIMHAVCVFAKLHFFRLHTPCVGLFWRFCGDLSMEYSFSLHLENR